ncbi:RagB/SusD family nutrient uptake outer membrane protein [Kaistella flava (ex Peng et al. 2021)]|uniref:RagB/SusD family nutrient uptake outer membrane protein n=1 Tax=Kaistella flava (ex Peng et al. 2021) TaxID=2038776 RepID=A0A7M2Y9U3_9FLAO|nr:RagB/SusD family nutrient uptake outer membrane protein [Kaistella flava (ex Peng et al. 2021)]QOW10870.1 RagB/SusD family nutrient uptake outer membrane protein [Kaistella flava (ex Peng et al. 2021)]
MNIKNIKTKQYFLLLVVAAFTVTSCNRDNIIELTPYNQISEDIAFSSKENIILSVNGMYQAATIGQYNNANPSSAGRGYPFGAAYFQQNDMRGEDMVNTASFYAVTYTGTWDPSGSLNTVYYWVDTYRLVNRANLVIEGVNKAIANGVISATEGNDYVGQALFFRAFSHYELLNFFARPYKHTADASHLGVPYRLKPSNSLTTIEENASLPRGTVAANYTQLLADLDQAESLMTSKTTRTPKNAIVYVAKEAAIALKTRVYLSKGDYPKVITEANKLNGLYTLESDPNAPFAKNYTNTESIFSLENSATNNPDVNGALASMYNGRSLIAISPIIWNQPTWLATDKRRSANMVRSAAGVLFTNKYKDTGTLTDASPLLRYSEVLLNRAEAKARTGDVTYLADLNTVRNRSLVAPATEQYASFATPADAVNAILMERRVEFLAEGLRWNTIHRLQQDNLTPTSGIPMKYRNGQNPTASDYQIGVPYVYKPTDVPAIPYSDHRYVWPIPTLETSANPVLAAQQNPGY